MWDIMWGEVTVNLEKFEVVDGSSGEVIQDKVLQETGIEKDAKALAEKLEIGMEGYFLAF